MQDPLLPLGLVTAIGRVAVNAARLESELVVVLWSALGHTAPVRKPGRGPVQVATDQVSRALDDLREVAKRRLRGPLLIDFRDWLTQVRSVLDQRHRIIHGTWSAVPDEAGLHECMGLRIFPLTGQPQVDRWSPSDVADIARRIHQLRGRLDSLLPRLVMAIPEMAATTRVGPPAAGWQPPGRA